MLVSKKNPLGCACARLDPAYVGASIHSGFDSVKTYCNPFLDKNAIGGNSHLVICMWQSRIRRRSFFPQFRAKEASKTKIFGKINLDKDCEKNKNMRLMIFWILIHQIVFFDISLSFRLLKFYFGVYQIEGLLIFQVNIM